MQRRRFGQIVQAGVLVRDQHRHRRADGAIEPHAGKKFGVIGFDLLPPTAPVAALPAAQFAVDKSLIDGHAGGQAFDQRDQALAVRFTSGAVDQRCHS